MRLTGTVAPDRPLLVVALPEEAAHFDGGLPVLLTGMGKLNAAAALAAVLAGGVRPAGIVNLGTAGALRPGLGGTHEIGRVLQHDLDVALLERLTGRPMDGPIDLGPTGPVLATGDRFVSADADRELLARTADLVDMEGYAIATVARRAQLPVRLVKHVSDEAGEGALRSWQESVDDCARLLADWARTHLG
ncbi:nucleosidase [Kitasatospora phosalacinea]|uniref:Nucleosidase n=1 Tax=Kitasatospora phosalacinea TaxID=2065 RepID=A0A9W6UZC9_9ACTN|nr:nucleosidase [Kitasatospora phosalacinea]GLW69541.1 nucleosidase [Kitasatospora phosalacinea]